MKRKLVMILMFMVLFSYKKETLLRARGVRGTIVTLANELYIKKCNIRG